MQACCVAVFPPQVVNESLLLGIAVEPPLSGLSSALQRRAAHWSVFTQRLYSDARSPSCGRGCFGKLDFCVVMVEARSLLSDLACFRQLMCRAAPHSWRCMFFLSLEHPCLIDAELVQ